MQGEGLGMIGGGDENEKKCGCTSNSLEIKIGIVSTVILPINVVATTLVDEIVIF